MAHFMLRKLGGGRAVNSGDRVALVFRPDEAPAFVSAFYGCIIAAVIPVCIEPPITKEVCLFVGGGVQKPSKMARFVFSVVALY